METTFYNVTITIEAKDSKAAYTKLCNLLAKGGKRLEWNTDTYSTREDQEQRETSDLFPNEWRPIYAEPKEKQ